MLSGDLPLDEVERILGRTLPVTQKASDWFVTVADLDPASKAVLSSSTP